MDYMILLLVVFIGGLAGGFLASKWRKQERPENNEMTNRLTALDGKLSGFIETQEAARGELNRTLSDRLDKVSRNVSDNLKQSGEKTGKTLSELGERLAVIDKAQQEITGLSTQVVELQNILNNKQARGAFGESQLADIVRDGLPENAYILQHTLSNHKRADCLIKLPHPPGPVVVDSKFPLEAFQRLQQSDNPQQQDEALRDLKRDTLKHAQDIAAKYIIAGETADAALMFLPSESVFSELHIRLPQVIDKCRDLRVYPVSPNTMSLTLNTVRAIMRDVKMREQAGLIQREVHVLIEDIGRLNTRVGKLRTHFTQANEDIEQIEKSTRKIDSRGTKITSLEVDVVDGTDGADTLAAPATPTTPHDTKHIEE